MKIRTDFVTNSSSSSFILAFKNKEDGLAKIAQLTHRYGCDYVGRLMADFMSTAPIPVETMRERVNEDLECDAWFILNHYTYRDDEEPSFMERWMEEHPGADHSDYRHSEEYLQEQERLVAEMGNEIQEKIGENQYIVELEYEDHTDEGSMLEHHILPECDFTVRRFSHH